MQALEARPASGAADSELERAAAVGAYAPGGEAAPHLTLLGVRLLEVGRELGVAVGRSLEENADPGVTVTKQRPLTFTVGGR